MPLALRLRNPPPHFVGRVSDVDHLARRLRGGPVTMVWGLGGLGKTSLVCSTIHESFPDMVPRTLYVAARSSDSMRDTLTNVVRGLATARGASDLDAMLRAQDFDGLVATALDLAEQPVRTPSARHETPWWVVVDNVHHFAPDELELLLALLARYARTSRWLAVGREAIDVPELVGQVLKLTAMSDDDLIALAKWTEASRPAELARRAGGSPWRLLQLVSGSQPAVEPPGGCESETGDAVTVPESARRMLEVLADVDGELSRACLASLGVAPDERIFQSLVRRGLVECSDAGVRIHEVARAALEDASGTGARHAALGRELSSLRDPAARVQGLRLLLETHQWEVAAALLDEHGDSLMRTEELSRLASVLRGCQHECLVGWHLRVATTVGDPVMAMQARLPDAPSAEDRYCWGTALYLVGRYNEVLLEAEVLLSSSELDAGLRFRAGVLMVQTLARLGRIDDAIEAAHELAPTNDAESLTRLTHRAKLLTILGRTQEALEDVTAIEALASSVAPAVADDGRMAIAWVAYRLGDVKRAAAAMDAIETTVSSIYHSAARLFLRVGVAHDLGRLDECRGFLDTLYRLTARTPGHAVHTRLMQLHLQFARSEFDGLDDALCSLVEKARALDETGDTAIVDAAVALRYQLATLQLEQPPSLEPVSGASTPAVSHQRALEARLFHLHRDSAPAAPIIAGIAPSHPGTEVLRALVSTWTDAVAGRWAEAANHARVALDVAERHGYRLLALRAHDALCRVLGGAHPEQIESFAALALQLDSPRYRARAELARSLSSDRVIEPEVLLPMTRLDEVSLVVARQARALLGGNVVLDLVDTVLVQEAIHRAAAELIRVTEGLGEFTWGIDTRTQQVWRPEGIVELRRRPLLGRILTCFAQHQGVATKEQLIRDAWGEGTYHPLRHDPKIHSSIRTLRKLIEPVAGAPERIVTTEAGYAIGTNLSFIWLATRDNE